VLRRQFLRRTWLLLVAVAEVEIMEAVVVVLVACYLARLF
jgi:hypothetical protein